MIHLDRCHIDHIEAAAERAYPLECCGLLVGGGPASANGSWQVRRIVDSANIASEPSRTFEVDPAVQIRLQRELRGGGLAVIGVYHSHPDGSPVPSDHDLALADDPELVWLVTAVRDGRRAGTTAHVPAPGGARFEPVDICIGNGPSPRRGPEKT